MYAPIVHISWLQISAEKFFGKFSEIFSVTNNLWAGPIWTRRSTSPQKCFHDSLFLVLHLVSHHLNQKRQTNNDRGLMKHSRTFCRRMAKVCDTKSFCPLSLDVIIVSQITMMLQKTIVDEERFNWKSGVSGVLGNVSLEREMEKSPKHANVKCLMIFQQNRTNRNFI